MQHDFNMVVADTVFVSTEFSLSLDAQLLIPMFGVGCFRQVCPGHGGKRASETAINYVDGDMKFIINVLEGSVKIFCPVRKEAFGLPEIICPAPVTISPALKYNAEVEFIFKSKANDTMRVTITSVRSDYSFVKKKRQACQTYTYTVNSKSAAPVKKKLTASFTRILNWSIPLIYLI